MTLLGDGAAELAGMKGIREARGACAILSLVVLDGKMDGARA